MCGIVGYIGDRQAKEILLTGLKRLENRGYDSAGLAIVTENDVQVYKEKGKLDRLERLLEGIELEGTAGIAHTRWATHGKPTRENAHPHRSYSGRYIIVHNGIISNYSELIDIYLSNIKLESDTDTEVVAHLIDHFSGQGMSTEEAFRHVIGKLEGNFAIVMIDQQNPSRLYATAHKSALLVGIGQGEQMIASDVTAMVHVTDTLLEIHDGEYLIMDRDGITIKNLDGEPIKRESFKVDWDMSAVERGAYEHFMLKEIEEQPMVIRQLISNYQNDEGQLAIGEHLVGLKLPERIYIVACGTSYHAGLVGKRLLESMAHIPTEVHIASEFLYDEPIIEQQSLFIFISQSGETADSRGVLDKIKAQEYPTLTITNVQGSTLYRESDYKLLTHAGPEIAIASTKAYTAQLAVLALLAAYLTEMKEIEPSADMFQELRTISTAMEETLTEAKSKARSIVRQYLADKRNCFFMGRLMDYAVCLEGALKLKEVSYIQAEGYAGGELKHGPIALIEEGTPVFTLITQPSTAKIMRSNVKEVVTRGAAACYIAMEGLEQSDDQWVIPRVHPLLTPLVSVIPLQLIAYYAALERGLDVDKPRNLAKSVTVE